MFKCKFFSDPYFPVLGPEKILFLDTFQVVKYTFGSCLQDFYLFWKNSQSSHENTCHATLCLVKLQVYCNLFERRCQDRCFPMYFVNFLNNFLIEQLRTTASLQRILYFHNHISYFYFHQHHCH